jgi:hypothetical protein
MMAHGNRTRVALASAVLAALGVTGCSSGNAINTGPFGNGYTPGSVCGPASAGGFATEGVDLHNGGHAVATVQKVSLHDSHHLAIEAAWLVAIHNTPQFGAFQGWPREHIPPGVKWSQRVKAAGARVPPAHGGSTMDLVVVLKLSARQGTARNIDVFYKEAGQQYHFRYNTSVELVRAPTC